MPFNTTSYLMGHQDGKNEGREEATIDAKDASIEYNAETKTVTLTTEGGEG